MNDTSSSLQRFTVKILLSLIIISCVICLLLHKLRHWILGESYLSPAQVARFRYSQTNLDKLMNKCVMLDALPSDTLHGCPLEVQFSCKATSQCLILTNLPCVSLHEALMKDYHFLKQFLLNNSEAVNYLSASGSVVKFSVDLKPPILPTSVDRKRDRYALVIATLTDCDPSTEEIAICCHVMHVRLFTDEEHKTGPLYTFWKTNWNRTLTPQPLFSVCNESVPDQPANSSSPSTNPATNEDVAGWKPSCCICLSVVEHSLHIFLPCRHAGLCGKCYEAFTQRLLSPFTRPADRVPRCPLCRADIVSVLCLPSNESTTSA